MNIPVKLEVTIYSEFFDEGPTHAKADINEELIQWLYKMRDLVKEHDLSFLARGELTPEFIRQNEDDEEAEPIPFNDLECEKIYVSPIGFFWAGNIRHTSPTITYETLKIYWDDLEELIKIRDLPLSEMPKYLNDEDYSKREIALHRMKGEEKV